MAAQRRRRRCLSASSVQAHRNLQGLSSFMRMLNSNNEQGMNIVNFAMKINTYISKLGKLAIFDAINGVFPGLIPCNIISHVQHGHTTHTHTHAHTHTCTYTCTHTCTHTCTYTYTHTHTGGTSWLSNLVLHLLSTVGRPIEAATLRTLLIDPATSERAEYFLRYTVVRDLTAQLQSPNSAQLFRNVHPFLVESTTHFLSMINKQRPVTNRRFSCPTSF